MTLAFPAALALAALLQPTFPPAPQSPEGEDPPGALVVREWLVLEAVDAKGRRPFPREAVFARYLLDPASPAPVEGETVTGELGEPRAWTRRAAGERGGLGGEAIAWAYARLEVEQGGVWIADLQRAHTLFVNGAGFAGDLYGYGFDGVPVELREGPNELYFSGARGVPRLSLRPAPALLFVARWDATLPDLVLGAPAEAELGLLVVNASSAPLPGGEWSVSTENGAVQETSFPFPLAPLALAKVPVRAAFGAGDDSALLSAWADSKGADRKGASQPPLGLEPFSLRRVEAGSLRLETFRSSIDGSVQEFARQPPLEAAPGETGLVLSLHGAGVDCRRQAASYAGWAGAWLVAPTNRRPFGFDWQDWGRADAYEVLERALQLSGASSERVYLTGHSMGGHGVWHLASNDPDRFAAIAPSAGWESFDSYGGRPADLLSELWQDADAPSRTRARIENLVPIPTFVLHGEDDDNVPASEARSMLAALEAAGGAPLSHFQPGAGHWWDGDAAPGTDCLTWPGIAALFEHSRRPVDPPSIAFTTADPAVDAQHHWLRVDQPIAYGTPVRVEASLEPERATIRVHTENARRIALSPPASWSVGRLVVDGFHFSVSGGSARPVELAWEDGLWDLAPPLDPSAKSPGRSGPFRRAFDRGFLLVHGSAGTPEETAELLARARFDAEIWWYRANGLAWILSDREFAALDARGELDGRNLILYGNADTNAAWETVLDDACPVRARRGAIRIGAREWKGGDLACLFLRPRRGQPDNLVGFFADSGARGSRLGYVFQTFVSGAGFPDLALVDSSFLTAGDAALLCAGWFDADWGWRRGRVEQGGEALAEIR